MDPKYKALVEAVGGDAEAQHVYEVISAGHAMPAMIHEFLNLADRLAGCVSKTSSKLQEKKLTALDVGILHETVRAAIEALRDSPYYLNPSMISSSTRKHRVILRSMADGAVRSLRGWDDGIDYVVTGDSMDDSVALVASRGRIAQVIDNLVGNARQSLHRAINSTPGFKGEVTISIDGPVMRVSDNGPGVDVSIEDTLFAPFVTTKVTSRGGYKGLGLFISKQMLEASGCSITLLPERNKHGRRFVFEVDFSGIKEGSDGDQ